MQAVDLKDMTTCPELQLQYSSVCTSWPYYGIRIRRGATVVDELRLIRSETEPRCVETGNGSCLLGLTSLCPACHFVIRQFGILEHLSEGKHLKL
ncbi:unnamed protein product [Calypogeia fissa]